MKSRLTKTIALLIAAALAVVVAYQWRNSPPSTAPAASLSEAASTNPIAAQASAQPATVAAAAPVVVPNATFQRRPFAAVIERGGHGWTAEDGRDIDVIRQLAHNNVELERMVEENSRIQRRQLVYRAETTAARIERNKLTGEPLLHLTLPGLDGREVDVEIVQSDLSPSGQQGAFAGRVAGQPDSLVTLAFKGGREAFTVIAPAEGLFLHAEPREPGEILVKSIDPDVYAAGYCGNP